LWLSTKFFRMLDDLPTDLLVSAQTRIAAREGVSMIVLQKGDPTSGTILLKVNTLNGLATVYTQVRMGDDAFWAPAPRANNVPEAEADAYLRKQADFDPDLWSIEVEDKQGRLWFPGKIKEI